jgi:MFS family permease
VLLGVLVYAVSGSFGLIAPTFETLAASRFVLGYAAGATLSTCLALVGEYYEGAARERMLGFTSAAASIATVLVLQLGGVMVAHFGWRGPFALYPIALLILPLAWFGLSKGLTHRRDEKISWGPLLKMSPYYLLLAGYTIGMFTPLLQLPILADIKNVKNPQTIATLVSISSVMGAVTALYCGCRASSPAAHCSPRMPPMSPDSPLPPSCSASASASSNRRSCRSCCS